MVKLVYKSIKRRAFTLIEIMIVAICLAILIGPIFLLLRSGQHSSLKGMMRIETTVKARNVLQRVYADLKMACFPLPYSSYYSFCNVLQKEGYAPYYTYKFHIFPVHQNYREILQESEKGVIYRNLSFVTYKIEDNDDPKIPLKKLVRYETFKDKTTKQVLTDRLNFFEIKEISLKADEKEQFYYLISLRLVDVLHAKNLSDTETLEKIRNNPQDIVVADFFDVVYPEYFRALWNDKKISPSWHTVLKSPLTTEASE